MSHQSQGLIVCVRPHLRAFRWTQMLDSPAPEGRPTLAQRFSAGKEEQTIQVPEGRPSFHARKWPFCAEALDAGEDQLQYCSVMWTLPLSAPQKIGIILSGLAVAACVPVGTSAAFGLLRIGITEFAQSTGRIHLGEYQPWLPIIGLEQGFLLGVVLGAIISRKVIKARLRGTPTQ